MNELVTTAVTQDGKCDPWTEFCINADRFTAVYDTKTADFGEVELSVLGRLATESPDIALDVVDQKYDAAILSNYGPGVKWKVRQIAMGTMSNIIADALCAESPESARQLGLM